MIVKYIEPRAHPPKPNCLRNAVASMNASTMCTFVDTGHICSTYHLGYVLALCTDPQMHLYETNCQCCNIYRTAVCATHNALNRPVAQHACNSFAAPRIPRHSPARVRSFRHAKYPAVPSLRVRSLHPIVASRRSAIRIHTTVTVNRTHPPKPNCLRNAVASMNASTMID